MIEEGFVRMYAHDFTSLATRAEAGIDVEGMVQKRIGEARSHAALMDSRKGAGHLPAMADRIAQEAARGDQRLVRNADDAEGAAVRRRAFLNRIAEILRAEPAAA